MQSAGQTDQRAIRGVVVTDCLLMSGLFAASLYSLLHSQGTVDTDRDFFQGLALLYGAPALLTLGLLVAAILLQRRDHTGSGRTPRNLAQIGLAFSLIPLIPTVLFFALFVR
jgi:hypothetical protein